MTTKLISLAGLLLLLHAPVHAGAAPLEALAAPAPTATQTAPQACHLAWQRVGSPLSLQA